MIYFRKLQINKGGNDDGSLEGIYRLWLDGGLKFGVCAEVDKFYSWQNELPLLSFARIFARRF